jgi:7-carboxy-7-deazaguanine synthase
MSTADVRVPLKTFGINTQTQQKRSEGDGSLLEVQEIFLTIQGEGPFAGMPAVFVRLAGCNLTCPLCDTDYTSHAMSWSVDAVLSTVRLLAKDRIRLVVITGGEPLRQSLGPLVRKLLFEQYEVQIETNGTLWDESLAPVIGVCTVVCSPKAGLSPQLAECVTAFKYVLKAGDEDPKDGLPKQALDSKVRPERPPAEFSGLIYLQPADEGDAERNAANLKACIASCMKHDYVLCLQTHKLAGLP